MLRRIRNFIKKEDGITAVEFSLVGMPFVLLLLGLIEIGLAFAAGALMEGGTSTAARLIRTGQVQAAADPEGLFRTELCDHVNSFINCDDLTYEVLQVRENDFSNAQELNPNFDSEGEMLSGGFNPGEENDIVLIRIFHNYEFFTVQLGNLLSGNGTNVMPLISTMVIKNEPYKF